MTPSERSDRSKRSDRNRSQCARVGTLFYEKMVSRSYRQHRSLVRRGLRLIWRGLRTVLVFGAALGPAAPPPPPPPVKVKEEDDDGELAEER